EIPMETGLASAVVVAILALLGGLVSLVKAEAAVTEVTRRVAALEGQVVRLDEFAQVLQRLGRIEDKLDDLLSGARP
ncbi:MAG: hypothetical protein ACRD13_10295, partial [Terriglobales bacterium]